MDDLELVCQMQEAKIQNTQLNLVSDKRDVFGLSMELASTKNLNLNRRLSGSSWQTPQAGD